MDLPVISIARRITQKVIRTIITPIELIRLSYNYNENETHRSLNESIRKARSPDFSKMEREWIEKIENKRDRLLESDETIRVDFFLQSDTQHKKNDKGRLDSDEDSFEKVSKVCSASVSPSYGRLIHRLVRDRAPLNCLELGTCLGLSTAFIASALTLNGAGRLVTLEGSPARSNYAESVLTELDLPDIDFVVGPFDQKLDPLLEDYQAIDFCYIDGHHDGRATVEYFDRISSNLSDGAVVVIDDITWSEDMKRAWNIIREKQEVALTVDTYMMGICVIGKYRTGKQSYRIMYW